MDAERSFWDLLFAVCYLPVAFAGCGLLFAVCGLLFRSLFANVCCLFYVTFGLRFAVCFFLFSEASSYGFGDSVFVGIE